MRENFIILKLSGQKNNRQTKVQLRKFLKTNEISYMQNP